MTFESDVTALFSSIDNAIDTAQAREGGQGWFPADNKETQHWLTGVTVTATTYNEGRNEDPKHPAIGVQFHYRSMPVTHDEAGVPDEEERDWTGTMIRIVPNSKAITKGKEMRNDIETSRLRTCVANVLGVPLASVTSATLQANIEAIQTAIETSSVEVTVYIEAREADNGRTYRTDYIRESNLSAA